MCAANYICDKMVRKRGNSLMLDGVQDKNGNSSGGDEVFDLRVPLCERIICISTAASFVHPTNRRKDS